MMRGELLEAGCWAWMGPRRFDGKAALFLDRDGVLVEEVGYLSRPEDMVLETAAAATLAAFNRADVPVILVTNQSGVARGYFDWTDFEAVQNALCEHLAAAGAHLDAAFACGYHESGLGPLAVADHAWRKPGPGMFHAAAERLGVDLSRSFIVGDRAQDLAAGRSAGLAGGVQLATGHGGAVEQAAAEALREASFDVRLAPDIGGALAILEGLGTSEG